MNGKILIITLIAVLTGSTALACEYKAGETKFLDYANCRYGEDSILVVDLPKDSSFEKCIYYLEAFRPEKLLAVTKDQGGKEVVSINDRAKIGNPCYLTKSSCDKALKAQNP
jgi:hypothetical protein